MIASISIEAANVDEAEAAVRRAAAGEGGSAGPSVALPTNSAGISGKQVALNVPAGNLDAAIRDIQSIGNVVVKKLNRVNVFAERQNLAYRLADLRRKTVDIHSLSKSPVDQAGATKRDERSRLNQEIQDVESRKASLENGNPMPVIIATIEAVTPGMPPARPYVPRKPKPARHIPWGAGAAAVVFVAGGVALWWRLRARGRPLR